MYVIEAFGDNGQSTGYLSEVDFEANGPNYPTGDVACTADPALALQFASADQALAFILTRSTTCPRRPDGGINRPLRALNLKIIELHKTDGGGG